MPPRPAARASKATRKKTAPLPEWDLNDFYSGVDSPNIARDTARAGDLCDAFAKDYGGKVENLPGEAFGRAIARFEEIQELLGKLGSYAQLVFSRQQTDPATGQFYQNMQETITACATKILFFTLAINKIDDAAMAEKLRHASVAKYAPWLRDVRTFRPYQLSDELERMLVEKNVAGGSAWIRLFDETLASMRFKVGQKKLTDAEAFDLLSSKDPQARKKAALSIGDTLKGASSTFTLITNTLAKDKEIEDRWRGFKRPIASRNVSNFIEDAVVDALIETVRANYPKLSHRYYTLKAQWFGKKQLEYWDRNAPLPFDADRKYSWQEAEELVLTSYRNFSPQLAEAGKRFFDKNWIDAPVKPGKTSGAFSHPTVPSVHPYILMNFQGKTRDVMTLAHELGHGVHQVFSAKQGALMADTPLTLAETASVFGEQLTFREMVRRETNAKRRKAMIAAKVEDMLNTVVRQIAFCRFEILLHDARKTSELTAEQISELWMQVQGESLGPAIKLHGNYRYFWSYIPHFIHSPFYVYAYAFGDCLVNSLYAVYEHGKVKDFQQKYLTMLEAGGTLHYKELLAPFGLDATRPDFWQQGLDIIGGLIDELES